MADSHSTESVLINGAEYDVPEPVAHELLRLHIELLSALPNESVSKFSGVEKLIRELSTIGDVKVSRQASGHYFVAVMPYKNAPLWWYGCNQDLQAALQECVDKGVEMRFFGSQNG